MHGCMQCVIEFLPPHRQHGVLVLCGVQETLEEVRRERRERAALGAQPPYTRIYY